MSQSKETKTVKKIEKRNDAGLTPPCRKESFAVKESKEPPIKKPHIDRKGE